MKLAGIIGFAAGAGAAWVVSGRARACPCKGLRELIDQLPHCRNVDEMLAAVERVFVATFGFPLMILVSDADAVEVRYHSPGFQLGANDLTAAVNAMASCKTIAHARARGALWFVPLLTSRGCVGAFAFLAQRNIPQRDWDLIRSFANQVAMSILRTLLQDQAQRARALSEADRFQKTLLDSIAHNVRTPLASIIGSLSTLQEAAAVLNGEIRTELLDTARQEAERLHRLLRNLLDLSRLESGSVQVRADPCDIQDVIGAALEQLGSAARNRRVDVTVDPNLPLVPVDFVLIAQVVVNLLDNAFKYSPETAPVLIDARAQANCISVSISDDGDGIPETDIAHMFNKFNRAGRSTEAGGIGLGLSICRGLIEAHHGTISAARRDPRGTVVTFTLPLHAVEKDRATA